MKYLIGIIVIILIVIILISGQLLENILEKDYCEDWGRSTGRETKYLYSNFFVTDCLVKTEQGWLSGSHLYANEINNK